MFLLWRDRIRKPVLSPTERPGAHRSQHVSVSDQWCGLDDRERRSRLSGPSRAPTTSHLASSTLMDDCGPVERRVTSLQHIRRRGCRGRVTLVRGRRAIVDVAHRADLEHVEHEDRPPGSEARGACPTPRILGRASGPRSTDEPCSRVEITPPRDPVLSLPRRPASRSDVTGGRRRATRARPACKIGTMSTPGSSCPFFSNSPRCVPNSFNARCLSHSRTSHTSSSAPSAVSCTRAFTDCTAGPISSGQSCTGRRLPSSS